MDSNNSLILTLIILYVATTTKTQIGNQRSRGNHRKEGKTENQ